MSPEMGHRSRVSCICGRPLVCVSEVELAEARIKELEAELEKAREEKT